ncbi:MAG: hypothetical protein AB2548_18580 [Candidatus Thiodiazotropha sp.]|nr:MAG: hypothetical protein DBO99_05185 [gamma proteobacterium symbiont of Ctena orbiculata]
MAKISKAGMQSSNQWNLHFLSWLDAIEKLDILILEIRHFQHTCIYSLREPILQEILKKEEVLLDPIRSGEELAADFFSALSPGRSGIDHLITARSIASKFVHLFPSPIPIDKSPYEQIVARLNQIWEEGLWSDSHKDLYLVLKSSQQLKRQIFADRITLFLEGYDALRFKHHPSQRKVDDEKLAELFLLRISVLSRSHSYLQRIGDLQQRLAQHLESAPAQYPRPSVHRRRMQGTYTQFLADRTVYLRQSMNILLSHLRGRNCHPYPSSTIFHRWEHNHTSRQDVFIDEIEEKKSTGGLDKNAKNHQRRIEFVHTGFWMLDKPDNQPILAHEVAHHALRQHYENLHPLWLATADDDDEFAQLMRRITKTLDSFLVPTKFEPWIAEQGLINPLEIACDLLALAVKGISYLYAFFLEAVGWGLEHSMVDEPGYIPHLNVRLEMRRSFDAPRVRDLKDWYIRGRILVAWADATANLKTDLDKQLGNGFLAFLNDIENKLGDATIYSEFKSDIFWRRLADRLSAVVGDSKAATLVKGWREERREDGYAPHQSRRFPRGAQRLPIHLRHFLVKVLSRHKFELHDDFDEFVDDFLHCGAQEPHSLQSLNWRYGLEEDWENPEDKSDEPRTLFRHVFDIPWQCAWLRAMDFFNVEQLPPNKETEVYDERARKTADLYIEINRNTSLGRRLFLVAMEIDGLATQSPCQRARTLIREIQRKSRTCDTPSNKDINIKAAQWVKKTITHMTEEVEQIKDGNFEAGRRAQNKQAECLDEFLNIVNEYAKKLDDTQLAVLENIVDVQRAPALLHYLSTRTHHNHKTIDDYYRRLTEYLNVEHTPNNTQCKSDTADIRLLLTSRASVAGCLSLDRKDCDLPLAELYDDPDKISSAGEAVTATCGYYNLLLIRDGIKQLCRCTLPKIRIDNNPVNLPIFMRRETWVALNTSKDKSTEPFQNNKLEENALQGFMAAIFIQLHRRFARLDYIDWINKGNGHEHLRLCSKDKLFLTDGWADVVLLMSDKTDNNTDRKQHDFFEMRDRLLDHFLVRRLESVATSRWFDLESCKDHPIYASIRIDDSSPSRRKPEDFACNCTTSKHNTPNNYKPTVIAIPGATDITLAFDGEARRSEWLDYLIDAENKCEIDRLMMQVGTIQKDK